MKDIQGKIRESVRFFPNLDKLDLLIEVVEYRLSYDNYISKLDFELIKMYMDYIKSLSSSIPNSVVDNADAPMEYASRILAISDHINENYVDKNLPDEPPIEWVFVNIYNTHIRENRRVSLINDYYIYLRAMLTHPLIPMIEMYCGDKYSPQATALFLKIAEMRIGKDDYTLFELNALKHVLSNMDTNEKFLGVKEYLDETNSNIHGASKYRAKGIRSVDWEKVMNELIDEIASVSMRCNMIEVNAKLLYWHVVAEFVGHKFIVECDFGKMSDTTEYGMRMYRIRLTLFNRGRFSKLSPMITKELIIYPMNPFIGLYHAFRHVYSKEQIYSWDFNKLREKLLEEDEFRELKATLTPTI